MPKDYDRNKSLNTIKTRIDYIFEICKESGSIKKALKDEKMAQSAIIMHLIASKEQLQRIQDSADIKALSIFSREDIRGLSAIRNIASHDYEGLNFDIIESVISDYLPHIKEKIEKFLAKV